MMLSRRFSIAHLTATMLILACIGVPAMAIGATTAAAATCSTITIAPIPSPGEDLPYYDQLQASGGTAPYKYTNATGLPQGMTLTSSGILAGVPIVVTVDNSEHMAVLNFDVADAAGCVQHIEYGLAIDSTPRYLRDLYVTLYPTIGPIVRELQALVLGVLCPAGCPIK